MRRIAVLSAALAAGCPEPAAAPPPPPASPPENAWVRSDKLDADLKEMILRAFDADLAFPLRVKRRAANGEIVTALARVRPKYVAGLVRDPRVLSIRCAPPATRSVPDEAWRKKVDANVRLVHGAGSACWTEVTLLFEREPSASEWREVEEAGVVVHARDASSAIVWAPIRAVPWIGALVFVARVEGFERETD